MRMLLAGLLTTLGLSTVTAADLSQLRQALEAGDTPAMTEAVEALYQAAGISVDDRIVWALKPYTETFNYFSEMYVEIVLGSMPADSEVDHYWRNWSQTLTGARWQADDFFTDAAEATALARYNQFVLAAHEMAHAVTYRYDPSHFDRHGNSVNCREFYADRLTAALLQDVAAADAGLATLRTRYLALMASMNGAIAEGDRYHIESLAQLVGNCESIAVSQPTPDTLQPYASAFFERQRLLLDADLPPLGQLAQDLLFPRHAEATANWSHSADALSLTLVTDRSVPSPETDALSTNDYWTAGGFSPQGDLFLTRLEHVSREPNYSFYFGAPGALEAVVLDRPYLRPDAYVELTGFVPMGPDGFFATLMEDQDIALLVAGLRDNGVWELSALEQRTGVKDARVLRDEADGFYFLTTPEVSHFGSREGWRSEEITPQGLKDAVEYAPIYGTPIGLHRGFLLTERYSLLYSFDTKSGYDVLAGNGFHGSKDGPPAKQEFVELTATQALSDGRVMILDRDPKHRDIFVVRELRPVQ